MKVLLVACLSILLLAVCGCSTVTSSTFTRGMVQSSKVMSGDDPLLVNKSQWGTLRVDCFTESRARNSQERHNLWMAYLPIACVATYWERPGWLLWESNQGTFKSVGKDMAEVVADELRAAKLFHQVLGPGEPGEAEWVLEGDVQELKYTLKPHLCGLSVLFAPFVGAVGLPLGNWSVEQKVKLWLRRNTAEAAEITWDRTFATTAQGQAAAYYGGNPMQFGYPYEQMFQPVVSGLLSDIPALLQDVHIEVAAKSAPVTAVPNSLPTIVQPAVLKGPPLAGSPPDKKGTVAGSGLRWAVVIGISQYADSRIPALRFAERDALAFYGWLVAAEGGGYAPANVRLLTGKDATAVSMRDALFVWLQQAVAEDQVTIYFAGHGSSDSPDSTSNLFLLPSDTDYAHIASTAFPMWDVETALKRYIKAQRVVIIADACHSAGVGEGFDIARRAGRGMTVNPIESGLDSLASVAEGTCVISASSGTQMSQEDAQWGGGHGVFTYFLLEGLYGKADFSGDGRVTLGGLTQYVSEQVRRATRSAQTPIISGRYDPSWRIGR